MEQSIIPTLGVPASSDSMRIQERFAILLALIAGYIDATGLIKWKTYVSFMSGNTTQLGAALAKGNSGIIFTSLTAVVFCPRSLCRYLPVLVEKKPKEKFTFFYCFRITGFLYNIYFLPHHQRWPIHRDHYFFNGNYEYDRNFSRQPKGKHGFCYRYIE